MTFLRVVLAFFLVGGVQAVAANLGYFNLPDYAIVIVSGALNQLVEWLRRWIPAPQNRVGRFVFRVL